MKKILAAIGALLLLAGCSAPSGLVVTKPTATPSTANTRCFDVFIQAYATGKSEGAYDCLSSKLQYHYFSDRGIKDDKGLNNFLRYAKDFTGTYDVQQWNGPIPSDAYSSNFKWQKGDVSRSYFLYPTEESNSIGYYTDGYSVLITIDSSGKVVDVE